MSDGSGRTVHYLFDPERESFAPFTADDNGWTVRQGGPVALWDAVEGAIVAWQDSGRPDIGAVRLRVTAAPTRTGSATTPALRWEHRLA